MTNLERAKALVQCLTTMEPADFVMQTMMAINAAEVRGAEEMRERAAREVDVDCDMPFNAAALIRALPLAAKE